MSTLTYNKKREKDIRNKRKMKETRAQVKKGEIMPLQILHHPQFTVVVEEDEIDKEDKFSIAIR